MNQMPDKIWLHKNTKYNTVDEVFGYQYEGAQEIICEGIENFVKYVPADAFIEKAVKFMEKIDDVDEYSWYNEEEHAAGITEECIEDFKKYMKGE